MFGSKLGWILSTITFFHIYFCIREAPPFPREVLGPTDHLQVDDSLYIVYNLDRVGWDRCWLLIMTCSFTSKSNRYTSLAFTHKVSVETKCCSHCASSCLRWYATLSFRYYQTTNYLRLGRFKTSFGLRKIDLSDGQLASCLYTCTLLYTSIYVSQITRWSQLIVNWKRNKALMQ